MLRSWFKALSTRQKIGLVLILVGLSFFGLIFSLRAYQQSREKILSFSQVPQLIQEAPEDLLPIQILIPKIKVDLSVSQAKASGTAWEISEIGASYLVGSGVPGRKGNVVIYGHNKAKLFGPIRWIEIGDEVKVKNKMGEEFTYKVDQTKIVSPNQVEVLAATEDATLTLYTCTGFLDSQRFVVIAKPSS